MLRCEFVLADIKLFLRLLGQSLLNSPASEVRQWDPEKKHIFFDWQSVLKVCAPA